MPYVNSGGAERAALRLALGLAKEKQTVKVIVNSKIHHSLPEIKELRRLNVPVLDQKSKVFILFYLIKYRPSWIVAYLSSPTFFLLSIPSIALGSKFAVSLQNPLGSIKIRGLRKYFLKITLRLASLRICPTRGIREEMHSLGCYPNSIIPNSLLYTNSPGVSNSKHRSSRTISLLSVGRLHEQKRFDILIRSIALFKSRYPSVSISLDIYGSGPQRDFLDSLIRELKLQQDVLLQGFRDDIADIYPRYDLFVLASDFEGFGNVLIEAIANGVRVISTDVPYGPRDIIENQTLGALVTPRDPSSLAEEIYNSYIHGVTNYDQESIKAYAAYYTHEYAASRFLACTSNYNHIVKISRREMYKSLERVQLPAYTKLDILNISHSEALVEILGVKGKVVDASYPQIRWESLSAFTDNSFDLLLSDQVLEHVSSPLDCFKETSRVLRTNGSAIITTCFLNPHHPSPQDNWRFTENGLSTLAKQSGLAITDVGAWGNSVLVPFMLLKTKFRQLPLYLVSRLLSKFSSSNHSFTVWIHVTKK